MSRESNRPEDNLIQSDDLCFAPCQENSEPRIDAAPRTLPAWQMTLDEFRQHYFPELCGQESSDTQTVPQRNAA